MTGAPFTEVVANGPCHTTAPARIAELRIDLGSYTLCPLAEACGMLRSPNWPGYRAGTVRFAGTLTSSLTSTTVRVFDVRTNDRQIIHLLDEVLDRCRSAPSYQQALRAAREHVAYATSDRFLEEISHRLTFAQARALYAAMARDPASAPRRLHPGSSLVRLGLVTMDPVRPGHLRATAEGHALAAALRRRAVAAELRSARLPFVECVAVARRSGWSTKETDRRALDGTAVLAMDRGDETLTAVYEPDPISGRWRFAQAVLTSSPAHSRVITVGSQFARVITGARTVVAR